MKRISTTLLLLAGLAWSANAQVNLPYTNGFDTPQENDDWVLYRMGNDDVNHVWEPKPSPGAATAPNFLFHDYPVGYTGNEVTDDWLVSDAINLTNGAKLSFDFWIYAIAGLMADDSVHVYLLQGNRAPSLATKTKLATLQSLAVSTGYINAPTWSDTSGIIIPAVTGPAYLAFRYTSLNNWFTAGIDDLKLVANTTGIATAAKSKTRFTVYPNPAAGSISWQMNAEQLRELGGGEGTIMNTIGQEVKRFRVEDGATGVDNLQSGLYFIKIGNTAVPFTKL